MQLIYFGGIGGGGGGKVDLHLILQSSERIITLHKGLTSPPLNQGSNTPKYLRNAVVLAGQLKLM
jgi:hypothetical protein